MVLLFSIIMKFQLLNKNITNNILEQLCFQKLLSLHDRVLHTFHCSLHDRVLHTFHCSLHDRVLHTFHCSLHERVLHTFHCSLHERVLHTFHCSLHDRVLHTFHCSLHDRVLHTFHLQLLRVLYDVDVEEGGDQLRVTQVHEEHHSPHDDAHDSC